MTIVNPPHAAEPELLSCLQRSPAFAGLSSAQLVRLTGGARVRSVRPGQSLFTEGEPARAFYALVEGEVHLFRFSPQGEEKVFQIAGPGDLLAEAAMFLAPPAYPMGARVVRDARLFAISREALLALCEDHPPVMLSLLSALSKRLYQAMNRIDHLTLNNAGQRLAAYLLELRRQQRGNWIDVPVNLAMLAAQLGMTPETLSRLLQKFRQDGLISGKGRTLVLLDAAALCEHVGLPVAHACTNGCANAEASMVGCCSLK